MRARNAATAILQCNSLYICIKMVKHRRHAPISTESATLAAGNRARTQHCAAYIIYITIFFYGELGYSLKGIFASASGSGYGRLAVCHVDSDKARVSILFLDNVV